MKKLFAEFFGTFWLVFGGCGSAIFASQIAATADSGQMGILLIGVALAFGLTVLTMAYAVGHISGGHFNPAVTLGLLAGGRHSAKDVAPYIIAQCVGAIVAAAALLFINGTTGDSPGAFATNFYDHAVYFGKSYSMEAAFLTEFLLTMFFLIIIMGATDKLANGKFAGIAIGLGLTLIHLISIPITNTSVNPARSLSQAVFVGGDALSQLWLFIVAPILGAVVGAFIYKNLLQSDSKEALDN